MGACVTGKLVWLLCLAFKMLDGNLICVIMSTDLTLASSPSKLPGSSSALVAMSASTTPLASPLKMMSSTTTRKCKSSEISAAGVTAMSGSRPNSTEIL